MLQIYGSPLSSPTNKVRYTASYLNIPSEFHMINLGAGEQRKPEFLKINPLGRVPAIDDAGFTLGESNAIIRYLSATQKSAIYPQDLQQRAITDQWIDFASQHIMLALGKIMFNTFFYKFASIEKDERSLQDGRHFIGNYLPLVEQQLAKNAYITGKELTLADITLLAALDACELCQIDLSEYPAIHAWRKKLMSAAFYQSIHESYTATFNKIMAARTT